MVLQAIQPLCETVEIEEVLRVPPVQLHTVEGFPSAVFPFTTDVPLLTAWGTPLLFGPGSFLVAHTSEEHLDLGELDRAIVDLPGAGHKADRGQLTAEPSLSSLKSLPASRFPLRAASSIFVIRAAVTDAVIDSGASSQQR